jgi:hypothetical protein
MKVTTMELGGLVENMKTDNESRQPTARKTTGETNNNKPITTRWVGRHHDGARCSGKAATAAYHQTKRRYYKEAWSH